MAKGHDPARDAEGSRGLQLVLARSVEAAVEDSRPVGDGVAAAEGVDSLRAKPRELLLSAADQLVRGRRASSRVAGRVGTVGQRVVGPRRSHFSGWNRNASMNGSISPSMTASTFPISRLVRWSLMSW